MLESRHRNLVFFQNEILDRWLDKGGWRVPPSSSPTLPFPTQGSPESTTSPEPTMRVSLSHSDRRHHHSQDEDKKESEIQGGTEAMEPMDLESEKDITIQSSATFCWYQALKADPAVLQYLPGGAEELRRPGGGADRRSWHGESRTHGGEEASDLERPGNECSNLGRNAATWSDLGRRPATLFRLVGSKL